MRCWCYLAVWLSLLVAQTARSATVFYSRLDSLEDWAVQTLGAADIRVNEDPVVHRCVELSSAAGTALISHVLDGEVVAGCQLTVSCLVRTADVRRGPQLTSVAKVHLAVETATGILHFSSRWTGSSEWQRAGFAADVPSTARRVVLNLGLEACSGHMFAANLIVRDDRTRVQPMPLAHSANAEHHRLGLAAFPPASLKWQTIPFTVLPADSSPSGDCLRLAGSGHEDWPHLVTVPIPAGLGVDTIYILHGALGGPDKSETPSVVWTARYVNGQESNLSIFQGRDVGRIGQTTDLENWKVAWSDRNERGEWTTLGVTTWKLHDDAPLESLTCRAYRGAPVVILAITAAEFPPRPVSEVLDEEQ